MCLYNEAQTGFRAETAHGSAVGGPCQKCSPLNAWQPFIEFIDDKIGNAAELWPQEPHRQLVASSSSSYTNGMREPSRPES
jgi:hypothetical protein